MSEVAVRSALAGTRLPSSGRTRNALAWDRARFLVIAGWLAVVIALPFTSVKSSSWAHLRDLVSAGAVTHVEVNGEMPAGSEGYATVELRWTQGVLHYVTFVRQVQGHQDEPAGASDPSITAILHDAPRDRLASLQPGLDISGTSNASMTGYDGDRILGFAAPSWLWGISAALMLATLVLLIHGPELWWATRWAWFWLLASPFGLAAFLLLSGPFPGIPKPRDPDRRLTGGWAFLLVLVVKGMSITLWGLTIAP